ncbi:MAG TPA: RluA family pseudouridine synthase, partial [Anaerolineae bacterium]|nr:RluA family pseudouridine synthase [Anaerolineae bacterium]
MLRLTASSSGGRLDRFLATQLPERSRSEVQRWIKEGRVTVNEAIVKANYRLRPGDEVIVYVPPPKTYHVEPEPIPLNIIFENDDLLVVDKPAGMVVHPAHGNWHGTLVNAVLYHCPDIEGVGGERRPGIVHRLDKETSGLVVIAKNDSAHRYLQQQFKAREVEKAYLALVEGHLAPASGRIDAPIGRHPLQRKRVAVVRNGRQAVTDYYAQRYYEFLPSAVPASFTLVEVYPRTGR